MPCPECALNVSDKAIYCPHCGFPLKPEKLPKKMKGKNNKRRRLPNGFGQISEIKNRKLRNPFRAMITVGKTETGRSICKPLKPQSYFPTYNAAYEALIEYNNNPYDLDVAITVSELYEKWTSEYFKTLKSASSIRTITSAWSYCSSIYNMRAKDIRARHINGCMDDGVAIIKGEKRLPSANMQSRIKSLFNLMLDYALEYEIVDRNYARTFNTSSDVLKECEEKGYSLEELDKHVVIQINDTHPSMVIPELIRLLTARGISMDKAIEIVTNTCAYTNHTILAEALEKWPIDYLEAVVPHLMPIIRELAARVAAKYDNKDVQIIDEWNRVHMARMDMHYGFSVNGVAALHTEILKNVELKPFYDIYPEKFNNKTNGITFRRWLMHCDKKLVEWMDKYGVSEFRKDASKLEGLLAQIDNEEALNELLDVKQQNKTALKEYLEKESGVVLNDNAIFDIQIKRLHEYKRQQMNVLYIIYKYLDIKAGNKPKRPITMIFGAKAAPAYIIAKDIIHVILCLQELLKNDPEVAPYLQVVMVENYNVTMAEKLIPACEVSEQISLASKEASGTGNMKFMLNGAVTLGTEDGANVEIHQLVGDENIYIFGESSDQVIEHYAKSDYVAADYYINDKDIRKWVDFIISPEMLKIGDVRTLLEIHAELIQKDWFMTLLDVKDYIQTKERVFADYEDRMTWAKKMIVNIAKAGFFSSDRTIAEYNRDIWHV